MFVHGASGATGLAAVQFAANAGIRVIGSASSAAGREAVLAAGACEAVNHREEGYEARVREAAGGVGPDVILEMLANVNLGAAPRAPAPSRRASAHALLRAGSA